MKIVISNRSGVPIYEQIKVQIKEAIFSGELQEDEHLPSIRWLAKELGVSVITTIRAYNDLEEEGFIVNIQGKGCYVLPKNMELVRENALNKTQTPLQEAIDTAKFNNITKEEFMNLASILWEDLQ